jgi:hypothetical protein
VVQAGRLVGSAAGERGEQREGERRRAREAA